jgi:uncharacterized lipoprotein YddW (UPF0748 family)
MDKKRLALWGHPRHDFSSSHLEDQIKAFFERIAGAGISLYLPFLAEDGRGVYRSDLITCENDYLTPILNIARDYRIQVHPLFGFGHISTAAPQRTYQAPVPKGLDRIYSVGRSLCASWKENRESLVKLIAEILDRYPVDGIQLDYFRYPNMDCESKYPCECQACGDRREPWLGHRNLTEDDRKNPAVLYREILQKNQNLCEALGPIAAHIKKRGKSLSLAARARYLKDAVYEGQDWFQFIREGFFDMIFPMSYNQCPDRFARFLDEHFRLTKGTGVDYLAGVGKKSSLSHLTTKDFIGQIITALEKGADGVSIYSYQGMTDQDFQALKEIKEFF